MRWMHVAASIACLALVAPTSAQVHRCKDGAGRTIYSEQPCAADQSGAMIVPAKSREQILEERLRAAEANERKYRAQGMERERAMLEQQRQGAVATRQQAPAQNLASTRECREARKELEFVSSIRTTSQDEKRMRTNAAITSVNAACGSNTPLMQEPPKVIVKSDDDEHRTVTDQHGRLCSVSGGSANCH